jgi:hypothetical protein
MVYDLKPFNVTKMKKKKNTNCHQTIFAYKIQFVTTYHQPTVDLGSGATTTNKLHQQK